MKTLPLYAMAHARSGDKGDGSNVGVLAYDERGYAILREWLTSERPRPEKLSARCRNASPSSG